MRIEQRICHSTDADFRDGDWIDLSNWSESELEVSSEEFTQLVGSLIGPNSYLSTDDWFGYLVLNDPANGEEAYVWELEGKQDWKFIFEAFPNCTYSAAIENRTKGRNQRQ